ncbi:hypothetical protein MLD38_031155 [Melastoma candidum]|uniref:Uncharacterized protein n=1 Tax=Melastoma candidum TaxID=119954 RepID=A0ACB9MQ11_9MYRT|nr:hypothetical protein MLD38_031155 [Melastoma candidum]
MTPLSPLCFFLSIFAAVGPSSAILVLKPSLVYYDDLPAKYAADVSNDGTCGALEIAGPLDACSPLRNGFARSNVSKGLVFALIVRGNCSFEEKIVNAQSHGFGAAIVYDDKIGDLVYMMVDPEGITVPAVFVRNETGEVLKEHAKVGTKECCIYEPHQESGWTVLAISLISMAVIFSLVGASFFIPREWFCWRRRASSVKVVDVKYMEGLPSFSFNSNRSCDKYDRDVCTICLEDYKDGEIIKVLPCRHEFHSSCVESWLKKGGKVCPVCKHDVRAKSSDRTAATGPITISGHSFWHRLRLWSFLHIPLCWTREAQCSGY